MNVKNILLGTAGGTVIGVGLGGKKGLEKGLEIGIKMGFIGGIAAGIVATKINADGYIKSKDIKINAKGQIGNLEYNKYTYRNINIDGLFSMKKTDMRFNGRLDINDPNGKISIAGDLSKHGKITKAKVIAAINHLNPSALKLTSSYPSTVFSAKTTRSCFHRSARVSFPVETVSGFVSFWYAAHR